MALCFRDCESDRDYVEERRLGLRRAPTRKVIAHVETQFVTADRQRPAADQRLIGAAVAIGRGARDHTLLAIGGQFEELDRYSSRRASGLGVEHMGRQTAVHLEAIGGLDALVEAKRGNAEDLAERR